jgi:hypothetical protein
MMTIKITDDSLLWKAVVAGQANEGVVFGFITKQRTILQNRADL